MAGVVYPIKMYPRYILKCILGHVIKTCILDIKMYPRTTNDKTWEQRLE